MAAPVGRGAVAPSRVARVALVGDRSSSVPAHDRIARLLAPAGPEARVPLDASWIATPQVATTDLAAFDGIWAVPGSPYLDAEGMFAAIGHARANGVPLLGTCGGFQHLLLEWARNVCRLDVGHGEAAPADGGHPEPLIRPLACSLLGEARVVHVVPGTRVAAIVGAAPRAERYFCGFGLDPRYEGALVASGLVVAGRDDDGDVRIAEWPAHPFFVGTLFQPELACTPAFVHPLIEAFLEAAVRHAAERDVVGHPASDGEAAPADLVGGG